MTTASCLLARGFNTKVAGRFSAAAGCFAIGLLALTISPAAADDGDGPASADTQSGESRKAAKDRSKASETKASENYYKTDEFIPGEEVVTPTGDKIKVWSSRGPVPVSPPPQPFDDPNQKIDPGQVIIDGAEAPFFRDRPDRGEGIDRRPGNEAGAGSGIGPSNMPRSRPIAPIEPIPDSIGNDSFKIESE